MQRLTVEHALAGIFIMWLFSLLSFVPQPVKDVVYAVVIILALIFWVFGAGA